MAQPNIPPPPPTQLPVMKEDNTLSLPWRRFIENLQATILDLQNRVTTLENP